MDYSAQGEVSFENVCPKLTVREDETNQKPAGKH